MLQLSAVVGNAFRVLRVGNVGGKATGWYVIARWEADAVPHREFIVGVGEREEVLQDRLLATLSGRRQSEGGLSNVAGFRVGDGLKELSMYDIVNGRRSGLLEAAAAMVDVDEVEAVIK